MSTGLFGRIVVPVANRDDAAASAAALTPYTAEAVGTVIAVNVVEKAGGAPDKASVEQREEFAAELFEIVTDALSDVDIATEILYDTDVAESIVECAHDRDASAIVFTPRGGSRWVKLLTGDVATSMIEDSDVPVVVLPDHTDEDTAP